MALAPVRSVAARAEEYTLYSPHMEKPAESIQSQKGLVNASLRQDPKSRRRLSGPALRTFFAVAGAWQLSVTQQRALLGWPAASTYHKYKAGQGSALSFDMLTRISLVLGIYKALHILYPDPGLADRWVTLPNTNPIFGGAPALTLMLEGGIDGLYQVRRLLDARRGGS
jgi:hypothetical protein